MKINWWFDVTNKIFGTKKLPLMIIPKNATFYVLPNCLLHQCLKEKWKWKYSFRNNVTSFCWTKHSNSCSIVRRAKTRGCFEWSLSMPASFIGKVRSPKRAFHFPRGATLRWQPSQPERANIFTSWKGKRQVPQQEQLQCLSAVGRRPTSLQRRLPKAHS